MSTLMLSDDCRVWGDSDGCQVQGLLGGRRAGDGNSSRLWKAASHGHGWVLWVIINYPLSIIIQIQYKLQWYWIRTLPRGGMYRKIHPPRPKRFPKGGDFAPRGPRDCPRAKPEGNLEGRGVQNPRTREISRAEGGVFSDTSRLEAVYGHSFIIIRELLILLLDNRWR